MVYLFWKAGQKFLRRLNIELPHDPVRPLLGIHPRKLKHRFITNLVYTVPKFLASL